MYIENEVQQTLKKEIVVQGISLHSGKDAEIRLIPAAENTGIVFYRADLDKKIKISAEPASVVNLIRNTTIGSKEIKEAKISTIEHLMAAIWGSGIDNLEIEVSGPEIPVIDGSAFPYYQEMIKSGLKKQQAKRKVYQIEETIFAREEDSYIAILPYDGFKISYTLDYDHPVIGSSYFEFDAAKMNFAEEISKARTFGFAFEIEKLHEQGLALGGSLDNAILIEETKTVNSLRFENEFVRHKILDVVGDMFLNGRIRGHIMAVKSGHRLHVKLAEKIREKMLEEEN
ncbi:UDP-3-O-acyl-N-acetylglucosamine deacetylase [Halanaerobium congolense]|uniref:UDP-3-O-acyl-N-acetylglucosamine deacetylase n=1 Tax=Halanaerobium congolense TaxID=54121 RepID=A0A1G6J429_9FIRM|nr:UDP-3-O-acyl-N-acetylglucosamine deacetylase [Halanaerobium congolense]KXS49690.1 MAG: UDP-3-O-[3-hydroxymyristoyl] N-acetylglucosamine deacetylase [Halanaerobium sp. T82-1]PTX15797.1 UDP-3-O-[3-hydroxymyristoyl] N-acetylglucosamine deacetylase [Halanaerobium congolense]PXV70042.1 UDP-3-O-[3-hydroxymyristoyl] N-acetylglucosamine deacetylase [Halanaerobium congolense]TDP24193.1 UDP-3-O-[3-hydroxymyristoyl] N-acetylglucosamine deacetylase [Halanaerobium congolense]TDS33988.1 UDP-3-O-[3-hydrox